jgi:vacuolar protein sorting-associated protein 3
MPPQGQTLPSSPTSPRRSPSRNTNGVRLKTVLFLRGSTLYDPERIKGRLMEYQKVLKLEIAVVDGKVGSLLSFLSLCSLIVRPYSSVIAAQPSRYSCTTSSETYCTPGGDVPRKIAQAVGGKYALQSLSCAPFSLPTLAAMSRTASTATSKGVRCDAGADGETKDRSG